jgi:hypothetical protein
MLIARSGFERIAVTVAYLRSGCDILETCRRSLLSPAGTREGNVAERFVQNFSDLMLGQACSAR